MIRWSFQLTLSWWTALIVSGVIASMPCVFPNVQHSWFLYFAECFICDCKYKHGWQHELLLWTQIGGLMQKKTYLQHFLALTHRNIVPYSNPKQIPDSCMDYFMMTSSNGKKRPRYWPFVRGIHRSPVNSPHKGQWRGALMLSMIWTWTNG